MFKIRIFASFIAFTALAGAITAPSHAIPVASKYKSCSYPPAPPGPPMPYTPNAKSWNAKGLSAAIKGVDVSMWQHPNNKPINFKKLKSKYGASFVIIKASDGGNRDSGKSASWFAKDSRAARAAGLIVGAYHYSVPGQSGSGMMNVPKSYKNRSDYQALLLQARKNRLNDAKIQARQAYANAQKTPLGDLPLTLDFEERPCGWSWTNISAWTRDFLLEAQRLSGRTPIIYANGYFVNKLASHPVKDLTNPNKDFDFSVYPLWFANWSRKKAQAPITVPMWGSKWTFWQFTSDGALKDSRLKPTVPTSRTDLDVFNGSLAQLRALTRR